MWAFYTSRNGPRGGSGVSYLVANGLLWGWGKVRFGKLLAGICPGSRRLAVRIFWAWCCVSWGGRRGGRLCLTFLLEMKVWWRFWELGVWAVHLVNDCGGCIISESRFLLAKFHFISVTGWLLPFIQSSRICQWDRWPPKQCCFVDACLSELATELGQPGLDSTIIVSACTILFGGMAGR